jgi:hypothetical protein
MAETGNPGEDKAWEILATLKPEDVCRAAAVSYDPASETYTIRSFGMDFLVALQEKSITSAAAGSSVLLTRLGYFFRLSILWYLAGAKEIACTGRTVKLQDVRGGDIFTKGSHVLPLDPVAGKYGKNKEGFIEKGKSLGGETLNLGDAALRLYPLPRIPVILALWLEDDEFPARADLLFDSTCCLQLQTDIIWSVAMMGALVML